MQQKTKMTYTNIHQYRVWDLPTRIFHWVNFLTVISLIFVGLIMMYKKELGISGVPAKVALKELHVTIGYLFVVNLVWRLIWGFIGNRFARWRNILPGRGFAVTLRDYQASIKAGEPQAWLGHNPRGRLAVTALIGLMLVLAISGLVRAGTDVYYPPFGGLVSDYVASPGTDPDSLKPYDPSGTDADSMASLKAFKGPFGKVHKYAAYTLMALILLHILFVVRAEVSEGGGLVSAMFTGKKMLAGKPVDGDDVRG